MSGVIERTFESFGTIFSAAKAGAAVSSMLEKCMNARTKEEEAWYVREYLKEISNKLCDASTRPISVAKCLAFVVFAELLGYKASFAYIHAVKLAQQSSLVPKKYGYLACMFLLEDSNELSILLVNTILCDLTSQNLYVLTMAMSAVCHFIPSDKAALVLPVVADKLDHPNAFVRTKAVIIFHHFLRLCPDESLPYMERIVALLGDKDPAVVNSVLQFLCDVQGESSLKDELKIVLIDIQTQILNGNMPREYMYRKLQAPWMQLSVLRLLQQSTTYDNSVKNTVYETLKQNNTGSLEAVGVAIINECIILLMKVAPPEESVPIAMDYINELLKHSSNNLRYAGMNLLEIVLHAHSLPISSDQQKVIESCLLHPDQAVKLKTLRLLCSLATSENAKRICTLVVEYAKESCHDNKHTQNEMVLKVIQMTDQLSITDQVWPLAVLIKLLTFCNEHHSAIVQKKIKILLSGHYDNETIGKLLKILKKYSDSKAAATSILQMYVWAVSKYYNIEATVSNSAEDAFQQIIRLGQKVLKHHKPEEIALSSLHVLILDIVMAIERLSRSSGVTMQEIPNFLHLLTETLRKDAYVKFYCQETLSLIKNLNKVHLLSKDMVHQRHYDFTLSFLDGFVSKNLRTGGDVYLPKEAFSFQEESMEDLCFDFTLPSSNPESHAPSDKESLADSFTSDCRLPPDNSELVLPAHTVWTPDGRITTSNTKSEVQLSHLLVEEVQVATTLKDSNLGDSLEELLQSDLEKLSFS